jgi:hypothetical protein
MSSVSDLADIGAPAGLRLSDSPDYDLARRTWNTAADLRPAATCVATSVQDVQDAIAYAHGQGTSDPRCNRTLSQPRCDGPALSERPQARTQRPSGLVALGR